MEGGKLFWGYCTVPGKHTHASRWAAAAAGSWVIALLHNRCASAGTSNAPASSRLKALHRAHPYLFHSQSDDKYLSNTDYARDIYSIFSQGGDGMAYDEVRL